MTQATAIDTELLEQYAQALGVEGLAQTLETFDKVIEGYWTILLQSFEQQNDQALRQQAHKVKGACRSLGMLGLAEPMEAIEKNDWQWPEAETLLQTFDSRLAPQREAVVKWLQQR